VQVQQGLRLQQPILGQHTLHQAMTNHQADLEYQTCQILAPSFQEAFEARLVFRPLTVF